jgi:prepilin-type N-terminal cleavage/methylation domain-containing protein
MVREDMLRMAHMNPQVLERQTRSSERRRPRGFTLMELMIVVVITGVLAAIAIPTFTGYIHRSRTSEATHFLGVIKLRQEAYRAEFGSYLVHTASGGPLRNPTTELTDARFVPNFVNGTSNPWPGDASFNQLGARPDGAVRFGYLWAAGLPGDAQASGLSLEPYFLTPVDHYFVAQARGNLDNDAHHCTFEATSFTRGIWFDPIKGWE